MNWVSKILDDESVFPTDSKFPSLFDMIDLSILVDIE